MNTREQVESHFRRVMREYMGRQTTVKLSIKRIVKPKRSGKVYYPRVDRWNGMRR